MGRPKKPSALLVASGSFAKDPKRAIGRGHDAVASGDLGPAPQYLTPHERGCWERFVDECTPGVLKKPHWTAVLAATRLRAKLELGEITAAESGQLCKWLREFAATPASSANVTVEPTKEKNEFL